MKYKNVLTKKPVDAMLWTGENYREIYDFLTDGQCKNELMVGYGEHFRIDHEKVRGGIILKSRSGERVLHIGDYVVKDDMGHFLPCTANVFSNTYEELPC